MSSSKGPEGTFAGCLVGDELIGFGYHQLAFPHAMFGGQSNPHCFARIFARIS